VTASRKLLITYRREYSSAHRYVPGEDWFDRPQRVHRWSMLGFASALQADFITADHFERLDELAPYDVIMMCAVGYDDLRFFNEWMKRVRARYPEKRFVGQYEWGVLQHKISCRNWEFQKQYFEYANSVDIMTHWHRGSRIYYELFCNKQIEFVPYAYPLEYVEKLGVRRAAADKAKLLRQSGYIHGRLGTDGFAFLVPLVRVQKALPEYKIQIQDIIRYLDDAIREADSTQWIKKKSRPSLPARAVALAKRKSRGLARRLGFIDPTEVPKVPLKLRGVADEHIDVLPWLGWEDNLKAWSKAYVGVDMDLSYTQGRSVADSVAAGTLAIGCNSTFQEELLPELSVGELEFDKVERLVRELIADPAAYDALADKAYRRLEQYNFANSRKRFYEMLDRHLGS
jgi:hypothetical protein